MSLATEISDLEAILNTGASEVYVDGQKVVYDLDQVRRRLSELKRQQDGSRRPRTSTINLSNF
jgi:hypothetical protein